MPRRMEPRERIQQAVIVDENGCWVWQRKTDRRGYGRLGLTLGSRNDRLSTSAHRYAYELWLGPIPEGMNVLHRCDNRPCCNPDHLFLGTQKDNIADMHSKGRGPRGYKRDPDTCRRNGARKFAATQEKPQCAT